MCLRLVGQNFRACQSIYNLATSSNGGITWLAPKAQDPCMTMPCVDEVVKHFHRLDGQRTNWYSMTQAPREGVSNSVLSNLAIVRIGRAWVEGTILFQRRLLHRRTVGFSSWTILAVPAQTQPSKYPWQSSYKNHKEGAQDTEVKENCCGETCQVMFNPRLYHLVPCCRAEDHSNSWTSLARLRLCLVKVFLCCWESRILEPKSITRSWPQAFSRPPCSGPPNIVISHLALLQHCPEY